MTPPAPTPAPPAPGSSPAIVGGRRRRSGASVKTLKRALKKAGLKVSGKKAALTRRAKKAHLKVGGAEGDPTKTEDEMPAETQSSDPGATGGRGRRSRSRGMGFPRLY